MRSFPALLCVLLSVTQALALVNPSLQPNDFFERHHAVVSLRVVSVDFDTKQVRFEVLEVYKGTLDAKEITVALSGEGVEAAADELLIMDNTLVAFVGKTRRGKGGDELLFYPGSGRWQEGRLEKTGDLSRWVWEKDLEQALFGTFNGEPERLAEMMTDARDGRYFFPATPFAAFPEAMEIGKLPGPSRGVALYDLTGDGQLDVVACSAEGDRIWLQTAPLVFEDHTEQLGLTGSASPSVGIGDLNGDDIPDLLLGAQVYLGKGAGRERTFAKADLLPAGAADDLKCAALADINGDGWPDVVVSRGGRCE